MLKRSLRYFCALCDLQEAPECKNRDSNPGQNFENFVSKKVLKKYISYMQS